MKILIAAFLALTCSREEVTFPSTPPHADVSIPLGNLRDLAERGSLDCGTATDRESADRVYRCAAHALESHRPFYCRYAGAGTDVTSVSPALIGGVWGWPAAYVGKSTGQVSGILQSAPGRYTLGEVVLNPAAVRPPRRIHSGMTLPVPVAPATERLRRPQARAITGIVIVETSIHEDGTVADARVIKPLPQGVDRVADALVRRTKFEPSRFFGIPMAVIFNVTVHANQGQVWIETERPTAMADEEAVTAAALASYLNEIHGGDGIALPRGRRPILLHRTTVVPSRAQLRVQVFSPANHEASLRYATPELSTLVTSLQERSAQRVAVRIAIPQVSLSTALVGACGPEFDKAKFTDAIAVSRPGFRDRDAALIYLEYAGGARAYYLARGDGQWRVEWHVDLWECG